MCSNKYIDLCFLLVWFRSFLKRPDPLPMKRLLRLKVGHFSNHLYLLSSIFSWFQCVIYSVFRVVGFAYVIFTVLLVVQW